MVAPILGMIRVSLRSVALIVAISYFASHDASAHPHLQYVAWRSFGPMMSRIDEGDGSSAFIDGVTCVGYIQKSNILNAINNCIDAVRNSWLFASPPNGPKIPPGNLPTSIRVSSVGVITISPNAPGTNRIARLILLANCSASWSPFIKNMCNVIPLWSMPAKLRASSSEISLSDVCVSTAFNSPWSDLIRISVIWPPIHPIKIPQSEITPNSTPNILLVFNLVDDINAIEIDPDAAIAAIKGPKDLSVSGDMSSIWYVDEDMKAAAEMVAVVVILGLIWIKRW
jgi:hypothetical protein